MTFNSMGIIDHSCAKSDPPPPSTMLIAGGVLLSGLALTGCVSHSTTSPKQLSEILGSSWTMVPLPNSALLPGAVVEVTAVNGGSITSTSPIQIRWRGSLQDCGVPSDALGINSASVPGIISGSTVSLGAEIGAKAAGITLGTLGLNGSDNANLTITTATDESLDYLHFVSWLNDSANRTAINHTCSAELTKPDYFIVEEAFVISSGNYNFVDGGGANISVAPPHSPVTASANVTIGSNGTMTIGAPTVFALKALQEVPSGAFQDASITPQELINEVRINDEAISPSVLRHESLADTYAAAVPLLTQPKVLVSPVLDLGGTSITDISDLPVPR